MQLGSFSQSIADVITSPGGWVIPVAFLAGAFGGYAFVIKRALDRAFPEPPTNVVNLEAERRRRAELTVAMAFGQKEAR